MTSYHGGKQRIGKKLAQIIWLVSSLVEIQENITFHGYCEPFCGMLGVYQHIPELFSGTSILEYKAGDINESVTKMWKKAQKGWVPPSECLEEKYEKLKRTKASSAEKGFIGHQYSFGGQYFKGYNKKYDNTKNSVAAANRIVNISQVLSDVIFTSGEYSQFSGLSKYVVYCDPPYKNTECHYVDENLVKHGFDHDKFWEWCRKMSKNNLVIVSENTAPNDFIEIFQIKSSSHHKGQEYKGKERLFIHETYHITILD
jgi:DNA adenine methylase